MPEFSINTLTAVVEQLPVPVILTTEEGDIVAISHASHSLIGAPGPGDTVSSLLERAVPTPQTVEHRVEADGSPFLLVALDDSLRTPPADVAALARATAHDFNNLLGVIINFTSLAAAQVAPGSNAAQDLQEVLVASRRAATLTQRLLQIAASAPDHETE
ncbi:MAG: hypothetical protein J7513_17645 [Solirubrobacteraceae bacterium]|nr:hypothetical protein [Solirubrobacteraceae bacterium]